MTRLRNPRGDEEIRGRARRAATGGADEQLAAWASAARAGDPHARARLMAHEIHQMDERRHLLNAGQPNRAALSLELGALLVELQAAPVIKLKAERTQLLKLPQPRKDGKRERISCQYGFDPKWSRQMIGNDLRPYGSRYLDGFQTDSFIARAEVVGRNYPRTSTDSPSITDMGYDLIGKWYLPRWNGVQGHTGVDFYYYDGTPYWVFGAYNLPFPDHETPEVRTHYAARQLIYGALPCDATGGFSIDGWTQEEFRAMQEWRRPLLYQAFLSDLFLAGLAAFPHELAQMPDQAVFVAAHAERRRRTNSPI